MCESKLCVYCWGALDSVGCRVLPAWRPHPARPGGNAGGGGRRRGKWRSPLLVPTAGLRYHERLINLDNKVICSLDIEDLIQERWRVKVEVSPSGIFSLSAPRHRCRTSQLQDYGTEYKSTGYRLPSPPLLNVLCESFSVDSQNIPCATLKKRGSWLVGNLCISLLDTNCGSLHRNKERKNQEVDPFSLVNLSFLLRPLSSVVDPYWFQCGSRCSLLV